jgi:hypothetical protein
MPKTVAEVYDEIYSGKIAGKSFVEHKLALCDWIAITRYAIYLEVEFTRVLASIADPQKVNLVKASLDLAENASSDSQLENMKHNMELKLEFINSIKKYFTSRVANLADIAKSFNQFYIEANFAAGKIGPAVTSISYAAAEKLGVLMEKNKFYCSQENKAELQITGNPALLSSKHNACPLIIGVNESCQLALAWHISYADLSGPTALEKTIVPTIFDKVKDDALKYIAVGMNEIFVNKLPEYIKPSKYYALPEDVRIQTFVLYGEPASYDSSYYPKSDTLILWGKDVDGLVCAWQMSAAVLDEQLGAWKKVVLGTAGNPMLYWNKFLSERYSQAKSTAEIKSEDELMPAFIKFSEKLKADNQQLSVVSKKMVL